MNCAQRDPAYVGSSITCSTQSGTVSAKSVPSKVERSEHWFGRIPAALLSDPTVSDAALRVYGILTLKTCGNVSAIGMRGLGRLVGKSPQTVMRRLRELAIRGDIKMSKGTNGQRARYELTSPVFAGKGGAQAPGELGSTRVRTSVKPSVICSRCRKPCGGLLRIGHCRSCNLDLKIDRKVVAAVDMRLDELARTA